MNSARTETHKKNVSPHAKRSNASFEDEDDDKQSESERNGTNGSSRSAKASGEQSESEKSSGFVEQLDMALEGASTSIGEAVKKIEALTPKEGAISRLSKYAVGKLETVQDYLGENGSKEMFTTVWQFVKRSPLPIGLGLLEAGIGIYLQRSGGSAEESSKKKSAKGKEEE